MSDRFRAIRIVAAWLLSSLAAYVAVFALSGQFTLEALGHAGAPSDLRLALFLEDMVQMTPWLGILAILLALGFIVGWVVLRLIFGLPGWLGYPVAGLVTVAVMIWGSYAWIGMAPVVGADRLDGGAAYLACGALAGAVFALIRPWSRRMIASAA